MALPFLFCLLHREFHYYPCIDGQRKEEKGIGYFSSTISFPTNTKSRSLLCAEIRDFAQSVLVSLVGT